MSQTSQYVQHIKTYNMLVKMHQNRTTLLIATMGTISQNVQYNDH